ncbi:MAG: 16S rRNA (cytosine(1402)-N(4))-methyltransferase RsmH [Pseudomonadota bacterium]
MSEAVGSAGTYSHAPVLLAETLAGLAVKPAGRYVDATYGRGGHAREVLARLDAGGSLVVLDRDPEAVVDAERALGSDPRVRVVRATFDRLGEFVEAGSADGVLFDLGVSSPQLDDPARGFSFLRDGPLDMRMDPTSGESAQAFLGRADEKEIAGVIAEYGEERFASRLARAIVAARAESPLDTTAKLAALVQAAIPRKTWERGKHPATRTFQALRIHVNRELDLLDHALDAALEALAVGGRLAAISFHSLEDRRVKRFVRRHAEGDPVWRGLPNAPLAAQPRLRPLGGAQTAGAAELAANPRARSAVLRVAEKVRA